MAELRIETLTVGGNGLGRLEGQVVFVPLCVPGDLIEFKVTQRRKRYLQGEMVALLEPSQDRCHPACPFFGDCGGCNWQMLDYSQQVSWKERLLRETLTRLGGLDFASVQSLRSAEQVWNYRSRVQFKCRQVGERLLLGFYRRGSHSVADIQSCMVARPELNKALAWLRRVLPDAPDRKTVSQIDAEVGCDGQVRLLIHHSAGRGQGLADFLLRQSDGTGYAIFLQAGRNQNLQHLCGPATLSVAVDQPEMQLAYGVGGFAQIHAEQNRVLVAEVLQLADLQGDEKVVDLYCGMGNLSLPLARRASELVGVEDYSPAIVQAKENASHNALSGTRFRSADAAEALPQLLDQDFDLLVLDPPRGGAADLMPLLAEAGPRRVLYISCDPATLARDVKLLAAGGYCLARGKGIDMFPQTAHIEAMLLLERRP